MAGYDPSFRPHLTSVRVWDVPSPVVFDTNFKVKVGVQCSDGCDLAGREVVIHGHDGARVASSTLSATPRSLEDAQYCAEVELKSQGTEGRFTWEVRFPEQDMEVPHQGSSCTFTTGVAAQPDSLVTVEVADRDTETPVTKATAVLRPSAYRGSEYSGDTDDTGMARVRVPRGEYRISVAKAGYKSFLRLVEIANDTAIKAELSPGSDLDEIFG